ncbi:hypothetical protein BDZ88DRAFT_175864 [Geranomyces variabilis]|nr:hypothetical protein BDZ88DRAFT_175864 [Geranomyces variabilis]KAJ3138970.1 hypothetical protein HDU90_000876 [Geranomyces variabilis]
MLKRLFLRTRTGGTGSRPSSLTPKVDSHAPRILRSAEMHDKVPKILIQNVLNNEYLSPYSYADFFAFLQREHSEENIEFCADVARYRNMALPLFIAENLSHSESHATITPMFYSSPISSPVAEKAPILAPIVMPADHPLSQRSRALNDRYLHNNSAENLAIYHDEHAIEGLTPPHRGSESTTATAHRGSESTTTYFHRGSQSTSTTATFPHRNSDANCLREEPTSQMQQHRGSESTSHEHSIAAVTPADTPASVPVTRTSSPGIKQFPKYLTERIELILCRYLEHDSEKELNIPESIRKNIVTQIRERGVMHPDVFSPAVEAATSLMRTSSFPNFLKYATAHDTSTSRCPRRNSAADRSHLSKCGTVTPPTEVRIPQCIRTDATVTVLPGV